MPECEIKVWKLSADRRNKFGARSKALEGRKRRYNILRGLQTASIKPYNSVLHYLDAKGRLCLLQLILSVCDKKDQSFATIKIKKVLQRKYHRNDDYFFLRVQVLAGDVTGWLNLGRFRSTSTIFAHTRATQQTLKDMSSNTQWP